MYKYRLEHHAKIARILESIDADFIEDAECYFAGGTAIVMLLDEYRESVNIGMMISAWGDIPQVSWNKARSAYGQSIDKEYNAVVDMMNSNKSHFDRCIGLLHISEENTDKIVSALNLSFCDNDYESDFMTNFNR
ncbi:hypothetical protein M5U04_11000 [Xenorhabdus sp. XENO-1]|uniref:hypothetical protein n=1 Tax=Xenorhabdus bovienii TaxID=40576 RepID=UPI0020CA36FD|nr:hypothetical protein [Xenorhabdus bovienii]MCP9268608.1 hypothetical protein [Xenorhabdus bovienii subsp. africana]